MGAPAGAVALTGATGFIGSALLATLLRRGMSVRALRRRPAGASPSPVIWIEGDVTDSSRLKTLVGDASALIHCAGATRGVTLDEFRETNVRGTLVAAEAARASGARFLFISSLAAREPGLSFYARSKREAEESLLREGERVTVLRPPAVYGPGDRELKPLFVLMRRGIAIVPRHAGRFSLLYVDDLAEAVVCWLARSESLPGPFEIDDGKTGGYDWDELIGTVEGVTGRRARRVTLPRGLLSACAPMNSRIATWRGRAPMLTTGKVRELYHEDWVCRRGGFQGWSGWQPRVALVDGLRKTFGEAA